MVYMEVLGLRIFMTIPGKTSKMIPTMRTTAPLKTPINKMKLITI